MKIRARSFGYVLATIVLALILGWAGSITWQELRQLHHSFDSVQGDVFHLSDHIDASVDDLNNIVQRSNLRGHPADRAAFLKKSRDLQQWIRTRQPNITTPQERELVDQIDQIDTAIRLYVSLSTKLMDERAQAGSGPSPAAALEQVDNKAASILELCEQLRGAERDAQTEFMEHSRGALVWLQE